MKNIFLTLTILLASSSAFAHAGHDVAPGEVDSVVATIIEMSDAAITNLGVETYKAELKPYAKTIDLNAAVSYLPEKYAKISPKFAGKVSVIKVKVGDKVNAGDTLLTVTPLTIGSSDVLINSPISGVVTRQNAITGQSVNVDNIVAEVAQTDKVYVKGIAYDTPELKQIKQGQKAYAISKQNKPIEGKIEAVDIALDEASRSATIYAVFDNAENKLIANSNVTLAVEVGEAIETIAIPNKAILGEVGNYFAFVKNKNEFERRDLKLGEKFGDYTEILEGIFPDEEIVTKGNYQIQFAKPKPQENNKEEHKK